MRTRPTISKALAQIEHGSEVDACEAAKQLCHSHSQAVVAGLIRIVRSAAGQWSREMAAYALSWNKRRGAVGTLLICASDSDEADSVRAQAVEGLAMHLEFDPARSRLRQKAEGLMIELLQSPSPTLRFWACFGLGTLGCRGAMPDPYYRGQQGIACWYGEPGDEKNRTLTILWRPDGVLKVWPQSPFPPCHPSRKFNQSPDRAANDPSAEPEQ